MKAQVTSYDRELLARAIRFLVGVRDNPPAGAVLASFGFSPEELARGEQLAADTARAFEAEEDETAWNFLSPTVERRIAEAKHWYHDGRWRYLRECLRTAEEEAGWTGVRPASHWPLRRKLGEGSWLALRHVLRAFSLRALLEERAELRQNLQRAREERPAGAPPPKDTVLAELGGWYERWRLLAQRVFRQSPEELARLGLTPGKAPPRLRAPSARATFGEGAGTERLAELLADEQTRAGTSRVESGA